MGEKKRKKGKTNDKKLVSKTHTYSYSFTVKNNLTFFDIHETIYAGYTHILCTTVLLFVIYRS